MDGLPPPDLSATDLAVLAVLVRAQGRVVGRATILRLAGLVNLSERRCDTSMVAIRRVLGEDAVRTVRRRGWLLEEHAVVAAKEVLAGDGRVPQ